MARSPGSEPHGSHVREGVEEMWFQGTPTVKREALATAVKHVTQNTSSNVDQQPRNESKTRPDVLK